MRPLLVSSLTNLFSTTAAQPDFLLFSPLILVGALYNDEVPLALDMRFRRAEEVP